MATWYATVPAKRAAKSEIVLQRVRVCHTRPSLHADWCIADSAGPSSWTRWRRLTKICDMAMDVRRGFPPLPGLEGLHA